MLRALLVCALLSIVGLGTKAMLVEERLPDRRDLDALVRAEPGIPPGTSFRYRRIDEHRVGAVAIIDGESAHNLLIDDGGSRLAVASRIDVVEGTDAFAFATPILRHPLAWIVLMAVGLGLCARARGVRRLDALVVASLPLVTLGFRANALQLTMLLGLLALVYLAVRQSVDIARGRRTDVSPSPPRNRRMVRAEDWLVARGLHRPLLVLVAALVAAATMFDARVIDVGQSSLAGATLIADGRVPYGNLDWIFHGDTYPPLAYLLHLPPALLSPVIDGLSDPAIASTWMFGGWLLCLWLLVRLCRRLDIDAPLLTGLILACGPSTLFLVGAGNNDVLLLACMLGTLLGSRWWAAIGVWTKLLTLPMLVARPRFDWLVPLLLVSAVSLAPIVALGGLAALGDMIEAVSWQFTRGSLREPSLILSPVVGFVFGAVGLASVLFGMWSARRARPGDADWLRCGVLVATGLQLGSGFWNPFYVGWLVPLLGLWILLPERSPSVEAVDDPAVSGSR